MDMPESKKKHYIYIIVAISISILLLIGYLTFKHLQVWPFAAASAVTQEEDVNGKLLKYFFETNDDVMNNKAVKALKDAESMIVGDCKLEPNQLNRLKKAMKSYHITLTNHIDAKLMLLFANWLNGNRPMIKTLSRFKLDDLSDNVTKMLIKILKEMACHIHLQEENGNLSVKEYNIALYSDPQFAKWMEEVSQNGNDNIYVEKHELKYFKRHIEKLKDVKDGDEILISLNTFLNKVGLDEINKDEDDIPNTDSRHSANDYLNTNSEDNANDNQHIVYRENANKDLHTNNEENAKENQNTNSEDSDNESQRIVNQEKTKKDLHTNNEENAKENQNTFNLYNADENVNSNSKENDNINSNSKDSINENQLIVNQENANKDLHTNSEDNPKTDKNNSINNLITDPHKQNFISETETKQSSDQPLENPRKITQATVTQKIKQPLSHKTSRVLRNKKIKTKHDKSSQNAYEKSLEYHFYAEVRHLQNKIIAEVNNKLGNDNDKDYKLPVETTATIKAYPQSVEAEKLRDDAHNAWIQCTNPEEKETLLSLFEQALMDCEIAHEKAKLLVERIKEKIIERNKQKKAALEQKPVMNREMWEYILNNQVN